MIWTRLRIIIILARAARQGLKWALRRPGSKHIYAQEHKHYYYFHHLKKNNEKIMT